MAKNQNVQAAQDYGLKLGPLQAEARQMLREFHTADSPEIHNLDHHSAARGHMRKNASYKTTHSQDWRIFSQERHMTQGSLTNSRRTTMTTKKKTSAYDYCRRKYTHILSDGSISHNLILWQQWATWIRRPLRCLVQPTTSEMATRWPRLLLKTPTWIPASCKERTHHSGRKLQNTERHSSLKRLCVVI